MSLFPLSWTAAVFLAAAVAEPPAADPVQDFRAALLQPPGPGDADARKADLQKRLDTLDSPAWLAEVLGLDFWRDEGRRAQTEAERRALAADQELRDLVIKKFADQTRKALSADDAGARAAAVTLLGATAVAERIRRRNSPFRPDVAVPSDPFAGQASDLVKRTKDDDPSVRRAAARALVEVRPDVKLAADAFGDMLGGEEKDPSVRRAAAVGLGALLAAEEEEPWWARPEALLERLTLARRAIAVAAHGLDDDDLEVRRRCLTTLRQATTGWHALLNNGAGRDAAPPAGFPPPPVPPQAAEIKKMLQSLPDAMNQALPAVTRALADKPEAAVAAADALEAVVAVRRLLMKDAPADPLPAVLDARPALAKNLSDKELRVRLAAVYVLEALGPEAAPASGGLAKRLVGDEKDADAFVRWGAARALGKMAPAGADDAVPALAKALEDKSDDVRLTAAAALARFGPAAKPAVAALAGAVKRDDGARLEALKALIAVGPASAPAAGETAAALTDSEAEVRTAAADALSRMGPLDPEVRAALRKALDDPDGGVRRAAAAALLGGK